MVANLTAGRKKYADMDAEVRVGLARSEAIRAEMTSLAQLDAHVSEHVIGAFKSRRRPTRSSPRTPPPEPPMEAT